MWGLRHKDTGNISAFFMHIPKTSGTRVLRYISNVYADEYEFKNILDMYNEDRVLHESIGGEPDPRHIHFPIENHAHITLDQAFCLYPKLKEYINTNNIDVFTIIRDPYERFVSQVRFIPSLMISDFYKRGDNTNLLEQLDSHWFHFYYTNLWGSRSHAHHSSTHTRARLAQRKRRPAHLVPRVSVEMVHWFRGVWSGG